MYPRYRRNPCPVYYLTHPDRALFTKPLLSASVPSHRFGILCFELATQGKGLRGLDAAQATLTVMRKGKEAHLPEGSSPSPDVVALMEQCLRRDPDKGFDLIVDILSELTERLGDPRERVANGPPANSAQAPDAPSIPPKQHLLAGENLMYYLVECRRYSLMFRKVHLESCSER